MFDRSFRASPSSLKQDISNSVQGSTPKSANGTVAQTADDECDCQFEFENPLSSVFVVFLFYLLFFINEDRNTVSSPPLQTALIKEVAYVNKMLVTRGTQIS